MQSRTELFSFLLEREHSRLTQRFPEMCSPYQMDHWKEGQGWFSNLFVVGHEERGPCHIVSYFLIQLALALRVLFSVARR